MTSPTPDRPKPESPPPGGSGVTPPRRVADPVVYDENGRLRIELPHPADDHHFYPVSGAVLAGFVDQVNELRTERDLLQGLLLDEPDSEPQMGSTMTRDQALAELGRMINMRQKLDDHPDLIDVCLEEADRQLRGVTSKRTAFARLQFLREFLIWERCSGCEQQYRYPHMCREHMLCGLCHPPVTPPMHPTNRDLNQMERHDG